MDRIVDPSLGSALLADHASRRRSGARLGSAVVAKLVEDIVGGEYQPGDTLPTEAEPGQQFGVSRTVIRESVLLLPDNGLVRRIQPAGSPARYEDRVGDNHHHLICRACGRMVDVDCAVGYTPCLTAADDSGYEIDEAEVIYWGRCPECVAVASAASGG